MKSGLSNSCITFVVQFFARSNLWPCIDTAPRTFDKIKSRMFHHLFHLLHDRTIASVLFLKPLLKRCRITTGLCKKFRKLTTSAQHFVDLGLKITKFIFVPCTTFFFSHMFEQAKNFFPRFLHIRQFQVLLHPVFLCLRNINSRYFFGGYILSERDCIKNQFGVSLLRESHLLTNVINFCLVC